jgi:hypothetical protein
MNKFKFSVVEKDFFRELRTELEITRLHYYAGQIFITDGRFAMLLDDGEICTLSLIRQHKVVLEKRFTDLNKINEDHESKISLDYKKGETYCSDNGAWLTIEDGHPLGIYDSFSEAFKHYIPYCGQFLVTYEKLPEKE